MRWQMPVTPEAAEELRSFVHLMDERDRRELEEQLTLFPMIPHPRQAEFLRLECEEALYGGAAGGGKSEALLMWLGEGIDVPGFAGLIFRRTYPQLSRAEGLIPKSKALYQPLGGKFVGHTKTWTFPSGATIELGHLPHENSIEDYQGPSYHRIAYDELTQFSESQYLYLFSRLRRTEGFPILPGMRAGSNPGGFGHEWVKRRFITEEAMKATAKLDTDDASPDGMVFWATEDRAFVPARVADNPSLDFDDYKKKLNHLAPVTRERLLNGDWSIIEDSIFKADWLRYYNTRGEHIYPLDALQENFCGIVTREHTRRFATIDTAGTEEDKAREKRGKPPSWSVCAIWDYCESKRQLFLKHIWRKRVGWDQLKQQIPEALDRFGVRQVYIENAHWGPPLKAEFDGKYRVDFVNPHGKNKLARSVTLQNMMEDGRMFLPRNENNWRTAFEGELLSWTGDDDEAADQVDVASYAAIITERDTGVWNPPDTSFGRPTSRAGVRKWPGAV
tara:strand:- start:18711 stop:20222 length:1512 start_codon:yes stop_codon:yes gene_type:complete